jgi:hypothetical protein
MPLLHQYEPGQSFSFIAHLPVLPLYTQLQHKQGNTIFCMGLVGVMLD